MGSNLVGEGLGAVFRSFTKKLIPRYELLTGLISFSYVLVSLQAEPWVFL